MMYKVDCKDSPNDGYSFILEATIVNNYKIVTATACMSDTSEFTKV